MITHVHMHMQHEYDMHVVVRILCHHTGFHIMICINNNGISLPLFHSHLDLSPFLTLLSMLDVMS